MTRTPAKLIILGLALLAAAFAIAPYAQAQIQTGVEFGAQTGLGGGDIRVIIGRIIQVFLGLLGVVALILIVYGGFLWMTSGGNEEQIARAKRTLTQAVIGLIIILSAFAIAQFVISRLVEATGAAGGTGGGTGGGGGGGGGFGVGDFSVSAITPPGSEAPDFLWPKNAQVTVVTRNGVPDPTSVAAGSVTVSAGGAAVSGTLSVSGNRIVWTATAPCTEDPSRTCLPGDAVLTVAVSSSIRSSTGRALTCGLCSATFRTGNFIDTENPRVAIASPVSDQSVPTNAFVPVIGEATDDYAVASVEFFADGVSMGFAGVQPFQVDWDTTGLVAGSRATLTATAIDAVGNQALAAPVTVTVRPLHCFNGVQDGDETGLNCGGSCGACAGAACSAGSECASGVCEGGQCVSRPRIDAVEPTSGGPGTLVTLRGASFGASAGRVIFLGADSPGDEREAAPCAPGAWTDTEVIVAVPDGAVSGPLELMTADGKTDRTNDEFGNTSIRNFTVNTAVVPGICTLDPRSGPVGTAATISGTGFGETQSGGSVTVAGRAATVTGWSGAQISFTVPNLLAGIWPVMVVAGGANSNSAGFSIPSGAGGVPHLLSIDPDTGPVGEYVTIAGSAFGSTPGRIDFTIGPDTVAGNTDFPAECSRDFWHDTYVTVKVPKGFATGTFTVRLVRTDGVESDNALSFSLAGGAPSPGLCRVDPTAGPTGTSFVLYGERLGTSEGTVTFHDNRVASPLTGWADDRIGGSVPATSVSGPVRATSASGAGSNRLLFTVANCTQSNICSQGEECCEDGTCRAPRTDGSSACVPLRREGAYRYRFSTGTIPVVPRVVEEVTCSVRRQSPSPYLDSVDACVNATVSARFNVDMNNATLSGANFLVRECGTGEFYDAGDCSSANFAGTVTRFGSDQPMDEGMEFVPSAGLKPGTWYLARILAAASSAQGVPMEADYLWRFRVRDSVEPCALSSVTVAPAQNRLTKLWSSARPAEGENFSTYAAVPQAENCNALVCEGYSWSWRSDTSSAQVANATLCTPQVRALAQTPPATPAVISATAEGVTGAGELTIKFTDPAVVDSWPRCQAACLQAEVAAAFNTALDPASVSTSSVKLLKCSEEGCRQTSPVPAVVGYTNDAVSRASITPAALEPNTFYRAVIVGGALGIRSDSGVQLSGVNDTYLGAPAFSWSFRTSDKNCTVGKVIVEPDAVVTDVVGSYHALTATPVTGPDECSSQGQRINPHSVNWQWGVNPTPPGAAELLGNGALNVGALASPYASPACLNTGTPPPRPACGNGRIEDPFGRVKTQIELGGGEECDDGNVNSNDGCSSNCLLEGNTEASCGNGTVDAYRSGIYTEQCDDGNKTAGDGCSPLCLREGSLRGSPPTTCGNNDRAYNEQCDDGNTTPGDGCSSDCRDEGSEPGPLSVCGNAIVEAGEDCDPPGSACTLDCRASGTSACTSGSSQNCCGNSRIDPGEHPGCDKGFDAVALSPVVEQGCDLSCLRSGASLSFTPPSLCGDGRVDAGETYDPGPSGTLTDPTQYAHLIGNGNPTDNQLVSTVTARADSTAGTATVTLQCGFTSDSQCPAGTRLGTNSCCYPPPGIVRRTPPENASGVCRNPAIEVEFDRLMDTASLTGRMVVGVLTGTCPADRVVVRPGWRGVLDRVRGALSSAWGFLIGRPAAAQATFCAIPGSVAVDTVTVNGVPRSVARFSIEAVLQAGTRYKVKISRDAKSSFGVPLGADAIWTFTTGSEICTLDAVRVEPRDWLFTQVNETNVFRAHAVSLQGPEEAAISPIPNVYAWETSWSSNDPTLVAASGTGVTTTARVAKAENGRVFLTAAAKITADTVSQPSTAGEVVSGDASVVVFLCLNPWPARRSDGSWSPYENAEHNFSFFYCRDAKDEGGALLPALDETAATPAAPPGFLRQFLFTYRGVSGALAREGIGLRVAPNPAHLAPQAWYTSNGFRGSPTPLTIAGYQAIQDGRTAYVVASNVTDKDDAPTVPGIGFTNVYLISYTDGAGAATQEIFRQIKANGEFNVNRDSRGVRLYTDKQVCVSGGTLITAALPEGASVGDPLTCESDFDCRSADPLTVAEAQRSLVASSICDAAQSEIRRDTRRLTDLATLSTALVRAQASSGTVPPLTAGTFLRGLSVSAWPSWTDRFAAELGVAPPTDPVNRHEQVFDANAKALRCGVPAAREKYEAGTCWNDEDALYACPVGSHVYRYEAISAGTDFRLKTDQESQVVWRHCTYGTSGECATDPSCYVTGTGSCEPRVELAESCRGNPISSGGTCGDGVVGPAEQCEVGNAKTEPCASGGRPGFTVSTCSPTCAWERGACQVARCGDGVQQGKCTNDQKLCVRNADCGAGGTCSFTLPGAEACDDGSLNGTYNHCNASCSAYSSRCGDGVIQTGEVCDNGDSPFSGATPNGQYKADGTGCALDCQSRGPRCGDTVPNGGEECDSQIETTSAAVDGLPACTVDGQGYTTERTRSCGGACRWEAWSACQRQGSCGNGVREGTEQCDDGNTSESDGCTTGCRLAACGDGFIRAGVEQCDDGRRNVSPSDSATIQQLKNACTASTCNYCTSSCARVTFSGPFCGDGIRNGAEQCDCPSGSCSGTQIGNATCAQLNFDIGTPGCKPNCTYDTASCVSCGIVAPGSGPTGTIEALVKSGKDGVPVRNVEVQLRHGTRGVALRSGTTDAAGRVVFANVLRTAECSEYKLIAIPGTDEYAPVGTKPFALESSGTTQKILFLGSKLKIGQMQIIHQWTGPPRDLDSHLEFGEFGSNHVYYANKVVGGASLDLDNTNSPSNSNPETITVNVPQSASQYYYWTYNWSGEAQVQGTNAEITVFIGKSDARGRVVTEQVLLNNSETLSIRSAAVNASAGRYWRVMRFNYTGNPQNPYTFQLINTVENSP